MSVLIIGWTVSNVLIVIVVTEHLVVIHQQHSFSLLSKPHTTNRHHIYTSWRTAHFKHTVQIAHLHRHYELLLLPDAVNQCVHTLVY